MQNCTCLGFLFVVLKKDSSVGLCSARTLIFSFTPKAPAIRMATVLNLKYSIKLSTLELEKRTTLHQSLCSKVFEMLEHLQM